MDSLQLKICDVQGRIFELSASKEICSVDFIKSFMLSQTAKGLDQKYSKMQWMGEEYLVDEIIDNDMKLIKQKGEVFSEDILYWIGYVYRYWNYYTGENSQKIYKQAPAKVMKENYLMFHTMDPSLAIEKLKEISA